MIKSEDARCAASIHISLKNIKHIGIMFLITLLKLDILDYFRLLHILSSHKSNFSTVLTKFLKHL